MRRGLLALLLAAGCATAQPRSDLPPPPPAKSIVGQPLKLVLPHYGSSGDANLGALKGKVVLIDFWATWCGPCHDAAKAYEVLFSELRGQGLEVYGVSVDEDPRFIANFLMDMGVTYPILLDPGADAATGTLGIESIPATIVVDRAGIVHSLHSGFDASTLADTEAELKALLAQPAPTQP